jgi:Fur family iron response transcriptional regulator
MNIPAGANAPRAETRSEAEQRGPVKLTDNAVAWHDARALLRSAQLYPTRQRAALTQLIFGQGNRHFTANALYEEAMAAGMPIALATVYNTLKHFTNAGMLAQIGVDGQKTFFDTNISSHQHFFNEHKQEFIDVPAPGLTLQRMPAVPDGYEVSKIDIVVRLRLIA